MINSTHRRPPHMPMIDRIPPDALYSILEQRDASYDGVFYVGVTSTGIFCRPVCPARTPKRENVVFYSNTEDALGAGFRPCKRCRPTEGHEAETPLVDEIVALIDEDPSKRLTEGDLRALGYEPATVRRQFNKRFNMSFARYARARRLGVGLHVVQEGGGVIDAQLGAGFESSSGFRDAFIRQFGDAPVRSRQARVLHSMWIDTPLHPMLALADEEALHLLEFTGRKELEAQVERYRRSINAAIVPGETPPLTSIRKELDAYFEGTRFEFETKVADAGTEFQQQVWARLRQIPAGETCSYAEVAQDIGRPSAIRAVANANARNRCAVVIPCHRVIGSNGKLTGYAGGLWRKEWLLEHEKALLLG